MIPKPPKSPKPSTLNAADKKARCDHKCSVIGKVCNPATLRCVARLPWVTPPARPPPIVTVPLPVTLTVTTVLVPIPMVHINPETLEVRSHTVTRLLHVSDNQPRNRVFATRSTNHDMGWIRAQSEYIKSLSFADLFTVTSSINGTHRWLIPYMRSGTLPTGTVLTTKLLTASYPTPLFPQLYPGDRANLRANDLFTKRAYHRFRNKLTKGMFTPGHIKDAMDRYVADLTRIIANAPPVTKPMIVYRGWKEGLLESRPNIEHVSDQFMATSLNVGCAFTYACPKKGVMHRIELEPGTRALFVEVVAEIDQAQVLLNVGSKFRIREKGVEKIVIASRAVGGPSPHLTTVSNMVVGP